jgi:hypothetical protein
MIKRVEHPRRGKHGQTRCIGDARGDGNAELVPGDLLVRVGTGDHVDLRHRRKRQHILHNETYVGVDKHQMRAAERMKLAAISTRARGNSDSLSTKQVSSAMPCRSHNKVSSHIERTNKPLAMPPYMGVPTISRTSCKSIAAGSICIVTTP